MNGYQDIEGVVSKDKVKGQCADCIRKEEYRYGVECRLDQKGFPNAIRCIYFVDADALVKES